MKDKYIKCFSQNKADEIENLGFELLYAKNGVWYFRNDESKSVKLKFGKSERFSKDDIEFCKSLNF